MPPNSYFPTYLLGALAAAQLDHHIRSDADFLAAHGPVDELIAAGDFSPFKEWLRVKVHQVSGAWARTVDSPGYCHLRVH